ncbi:putative Vascular endothelial growth factor receptor 1 [Hypsibius exemplaris]|uniref:Vascular endothelial growth factor receptor 1 n=1 Tax=Hypsibius exemplaris TaxID=2072580 RepID=A0A9X6RL56_HYPEX|nr:putative Vascular endothelial growth factor receptor 1 [Hypsibius exemplaris]
MTAAPRGGSGMAAPSRSAPLNKLRFFRRSAASLRFCAAELNRNSSSDVLYQSSTIKSGGSLLAGKSVWSPSRNVQLTMQKDGNLVLFRQCDGKAIWTSTTNYATDPPQAVVMQTDGRLAIYDGKQRLVWSAGTGDKRFAGAKLRVNDDGTMCIAKEDPVCLWNSGGYALCKPAQSNAFKDAKVILKPGAKLLMGRAVHSNEESCEMTVQPDGDLTVSRKCDGAEIFSLRYGHGRSANRKWENVTSIQGIGVTLNGNIEFYWPNGTVKLKYRNVQDRFAESAGADLRLNNDCTLCVYKDGACLWTSDALTYKCSMLEPGGVLYAGQSIWSPNHAVKLKLQSDGNLVLFRQCDGRSIWESSTTYDHSLPHYLSMQEDGNLAMFNQNQTLVWSTGTAMARFAGATLHVQNNGTICIRKRGVCLWTSGGFSLCDPILAPQFQDAQVVLKPGTKLAQGQTLFSKERTCNLTVQTDGSLMVYRKCDGAAITAVRHGVGKPDSLGLDSDDYVFAFGINRHGDLELFRSSTARAETFKDVDGHSDSALDADLRLRDDDCRLCVFKDGACLWTASAMLQDCLVDDDDLGSQSAITGGAVGGFVLCVLVVGIPLLICLKRRERKQASFLRSKHKRESISANLYNFKIGHEENDDQQFKAICAQYLSLLEVPAQNLELSDHVLGKGTFGVVYRGMAHRLVTVSESPIVVAVKTIKGAYVADPHQVAILHEELETMLKCGRHINIVNIMGVVREDPPCLLLEFCLYGTLLTFLKDRQNTFYSHLDEAGHLAPYNEGELKQILARNPDKRQLLGQEPIMNLQEFMLSTSDLIQFSHQISRGMEYLNSRFMIHRDLAARNVLVAEGRIMKISDFGLAIYEPDVYASSSTTLALPILWMPPEAILAKQFSQMSDVWAYGVTLWEIFTLGGVPYENKPVSKMSATVFAHWLLDGNQVSRPDNAPHSIFQLMKSCWNLDPLNRPTFAELCQNLMGIMSLAGEADPYLLLDTSTALEHNERFAELDRQMMECLQNEVEAEIAEKMPDETSEV